MIRINIVRQYVRDIELSATWLQLNEHHHAMAGMFRSHYEQMTFDDRKKYFENIAGKGSLRLDLAWYPEPGRSGGICVSSLSEDKNGEIESIFLENAYRNQGIGSALIQRALAWMDECGATRKRVSVGDGNEGAWKFYEKFEFYPRMTVLEQKTGHGAH